MTQYTISLTEDQENGLMLYALSVGHPITDPPPTNWVAQFVRTLAARDTLEGARVELTQQATADITAAIAALREHLTGDSPDAAPPQPDGGK